jgi:Lrp/AsnC family transcriptional regulator, regulator for asnA, asnC and gidA
MSKTVLDVLDYAIIHLLTEDGRMSTGEMAKKLDVTAPTIRSRVKILEENGLFKVTGVIDPSRHQNMITALVAMNIQSEGQMDKIRTKISQLPNVAWVGLVAGRYDIIAEVVCMGGVDELSKFTTETILEIGNVVKSETFIIMKSNQNWLKLPEGVGKM